MNDRSRSELISSLRMLLPAAHVILADSVESAPSSKGAYALMIRLAVTVNFAGPPSACRFAPGWYVYAGSAYGPGGVRARLRRHLRRDKRLRWHVDHLTLAAEQVEALAFEDGSECDIVARLLKSSAFEPPLKGFGSSDCRICTSHFLGWHGGR